MSTHIEQKNNIIGLCKYTQDYLDTIHVEYRDSHQYRSDTLTELLSTHSFGHNPLDMGVYISKPNEHSESFHEIIEFDNEKSGIKTIYFAVFDHHSMTKSVDLVKYLPSGSQIYKIDKNAEDFPSIIKNLITRFRSINGYTTFVTAIVDIYNENEIETNTKNTKKLDFRIEQFRYVANTNIPLCIYVCDQTRPYIENLVKEGYTNIKIMDENYKDFDIYSIIFSQKQDLNLPIQRTEHKDTFEYLSLMHSKMDFIKNAMDHNFWHHDNYAWVDFNVMHVGKSEEDKSYMQHYLSEISNISSEHFDQMVVPGCWEKGIYIHRILDHIHWRFCGGFFVGNIQALREMFDLYMLFLPEFLQTHKTMVWEVNFWAWLEYYKNWKPHWYEADHNRKILAVPQLQFSQKNQIITLHDKCDIVSIFEHTEREHFVPSSSSYVYFKGHHLLNVRYVNYMMDDGGYYHYRDDSGIIKTQNHLYYLDVDIVPTIQTDLGGWMSEKHIHLRKHNSFSQGLEDIRLYEFNGQLRFIATTIEYYSTNGARMMIGDYCHKTMTYDNVKIIDSPTNSYFEKNWAPICDKSNKELFIYSWNPMTIGEIDGSKLNILFSHDLSDIPLLQKCKGSTSFCAKEGTNHFIGLVHYSVDTTPRTYYHILVELDEKYIPIKMSNPFVFFKHSIEFCIGMLSKSHHYIFFISQMDRSPINMMIHKDSLELHSILPRY